MLKIVFLAISTTALCMAFGTQPVAGGQADCCGAGNGASCEVACPCCNHVCKLSSQMVKEKNYCWNVVCEPICIPKVRFPWEKSCKPKCAKVKYVNVLKKHEYECERCKYTWTPVCADCGCNGTGNCGCANGDCCAGGNCSDVGCDSATQPVAPTEKTDAQAFRIPMPMLDTTPTRSLRQSSPATPLKPVAKRTLSDT